MTYRDNVNYTHSIGFDGAVTYNDSVETRYDDTVYRHSLVKQ